MSWQCALEIKKTTHRYVPRGTRLVGSRLDSASYNNALGHQMRPDGQIGRRPRSLSNRWSETNDDGEGAIGNRNESDKQGMRPSFSLFLSSVTAIEEKKQLKKLAWVKSSWTMMTRANWFVVLGSHLPNHLPTWSVHQIPDWSLHINVAQAPPAFSSAP